MGVSRDGEVDGTGEKDKTQDFKTQDGGKREPDG